jgi:hypothetical protein
MSAAAQFRRWAANKFQVYENKTMSEIWTPPPIVLSHAQIFTETELDRFERSILTNPMANEHDASRFFREFPKFLYMGQGAEIRSEVILYRTDGKPAKRLDFLRRSYGNRFWDIIEIKDPQKPFIVSDKSLHPRLSADVEKAISQALNYRDFIDENVDARSQLISQSIMVYRPQITVIVGKHGYGLCPEKLQVLYDRVRNRGPIEAFTYEDVYEFAKEHYKSNRILVAAALFYPNPLQDFSQQVITLLYEFYETAGFPSLDVQNEHKINELVKAGLIEFHVYDDHGGWLYQLTKQGWDILERIYGLNKIPPKDWRFKRKVTL